MQDSRQQPHRSADFIRSCASLVKVIKGEGKSNLLAWFFLYKEPRTKDEPLPGRAYNSMEGIDMVRNTAPKPLLLYTSAYNTMCVYNALETRTWFVQMCTALDSVVNNHETTRKETCGTTTGRKRKPRSTLRSVYFGNAGPRRFSF